MTQEVNKEEITEDNFEEFTSEQERNTIKLVSICQQCKHPITEGIHYLLQGSDILYGFYDSYRKCRVSGCFCEVLIGHFEPPGFLMK
jgi:hypothetical protein